MPPACPSGLLELALRVGRRRTEFQPRKRRCHCNRCAHSGLGNRLISCKCRCIIRPAPVPAQARAGVRTDAQGGDPRPACALRLRAHGSLPPRRGRKAGGGRENLAGAGRGRAGARPGPAGPGGDSESFKLAGAGVFLAWTRAGAVSRLRVLRERRMRERRMRWKAASGLASAVCARWILLVRPSSPRLGHGADA